MALDGKILFKVNIDGRHVDPDHISFTFMDQKNIVNNRMRYVCAGFSQKEINDTGSLEGVVLILRQMADSVERAIKEIDPQSDDGLYNFFPDLDREANDAT